MRFNQQFVDFYEKMSKIDIDPSPARHEAQELLDEYRDDYIMAKAQELAYKLQFKGPDEFPFGYYLNLAIQQIKSELDKE